MLKASHLFVSVIILMALATDACSTWYISSRVQESKQERVQEIKADELRTIKVIIKENMEKAQLQADTVKNTSEQDILAEYTGKTDSLLFDLNNIGDFPVYNILYNNIRGEYLNVDNDNNDMNVWTKLGKVVDTSKNCAFKKGEVVTIEGEVQKQNSKPLAKIAIKAIMNQESSWKYVFWNYLPTPEGFYIPETMDESEIDTLYYRYGYKGLSYLEFLTASYLRQDSDIFGVRDVDQNGVMTDNNKIVFVQGFNIVDDLEKNHADLLQYYSDWQDTTEKEYTNQYRIVVLTGIFMFVILIMSFISVIKGVINK